MRLTPVLLVLLALAPGALAANLPEQKVRQLVSPLIEMEHANGVVVGLIDSGGRRDVYGFGVTRAGDRAPPDGRTVFEIGSCTKLFTAMLLAHMVTTGDVKLDQPVSQLLPPDVKVPAGEGGEAITLLHLATHTSGLPRMPVYFLRADPANPYADYTARDLYDELRSLSLSRRPGQSYEYSNLGAGLLGHALELKAAKPYEQLVVERICEPLGMKDTRVTLDESLRKRLAQGHHAVGPEVSGWDFSALAGAGALRSTADDMLTFLAANMELIDSPEPLKSAIRMTHERRAAGRAQSDVALGWHIGKRTGARHHSGMTGGYFAFIAFVPAPVPAPAPLPAPAREERVGVVVLANTAAYIVDAVGVQLVRATLGEDVRPLPGGAAP